MKPQDFRAFSEVPPPPCEEVGEPRSLDNGNHRARAGWGGEPEATDNNTAKRAKALRKNTTLAERILWSALRQLKPAGLHFRRQAPFGRYVLDFVCHSAKLVVEVDGSQHGTAEGIECDARRTEFLKSQGYRVIRFWNVDVITNSSEISDAIYKIAKDFVLPPPGGEVGEPRSLDNGNYRARAGWGDGAAESSPPEIAARFRPPHKGEVENDPFR